MNPLLQPMPDPGRTHRAALRIVSLGGGVVISLLILFGISRAQQTTFIQPAAMREELRAFLADPPPPPPAPVSPAPVEPPPPATLDLAPEPTPGGIVVPAAHKTFEAPPPETPEISFLLDWEALRPALTPASDGNGQVYQTTDVDRRPVPIFRKAPAVLQSRIEHLDHPTVELLFIVKPNGRADNIQVLSAPNEELARAAVNAMREWKFRPAMRGGEKVRCLVQQTIILRSSPSRPFGQ